ncbi:MAG: CPBP family intramembrane metalloprotease [Candidatus Rokubacteria bacterium]|nr:CPBP family intramembrane metalloprotease [Candidatus Rokubacteria bacterium]
MDSVPAPAERRHVGVLTALSAVVLLAFAGLLLWLQATGTRVEDVAEPERALALIVGRTLDLDDAVARAPGWERRLHALLMNGRQEDLDEGIRWFEEVADVSLDPEVDLRLAILEGEAGRLDRVRRRAAGLELPSRGSPALGALLGVAYLGVTAGEDERRALREVLEERRGDDWFSDRLALRWAARTDDAKLADQAREALDARGDRLLWRLRVLSVVALALLGAGAAALVVVARRGAGGPLGAAAFPPPWRGREGVVVLVRGGAAGAVFLVALFVAFGGAGERPWAKLVLAAGTTLAFVPALALARVRLLQPAGLGFRNALGLGLPPGGARRLLLVVLALLAASQLGELGLSLAARALELSSHWTEWFDRDLAWGPRGLVGLTVFDTVVLTPILEEGVFRGLLFATLRRRFGLAASATLSAAVFAVAHGYGVLGFVAVFWSGLVWAVAYEKTGSLLPPIVAHGVDNLTASLAVVLMLRG